MDMKDSCFGLPTICRIERDLIHRDKIVFESQFGYLKRNRCLFWEEKPFVNRAKDIEQIFPIHKMI
jgi:hypothetical protein